MCRNPLLAEERSRKREELLTATETELGTILKATQRERRRLKGEIKIRQRVHKVVDKYKMKKHFLLDITDDRFSYRRNPPHRRRGRPATRTSLKQETVKAYRGSAWLSASAASSDLKVRPIHHRLASRVRAHLLRLAYYVGSHAPLPGADAAEEAHLGGGCGQAVGLGPENPNTAPTASPSTASGPAGRLGPVKQRVQPSAAGSPPTS